MRQNETITDTISIFVIPIQDDVDIEATISYEDTGIGYYECHGAVGYDSNYQWALSRFHVIGREETKEISHYIYSNEDDIIEKVLKQN